MGSELTINYKKGGFSGYANTAYSHALGKDVELPVSFNFLRMISIMLPIIGYLWTMTRALQFPPGWRMSLIIPDISVE